LWLTLVLGPGPALAPFTDEELSSACRDIAGAEAVLSEWSGSADVDAMIDYYKQITDVIGSRVAQATGVEQLNVALHDVLGAIWMALEAPDWPNPLPDDQILRAEFALRKPTGALAILAPDGRLRLDDPLPSAQLPELATRPRPNR
jgi:hypothetical protein